MWQAVSNDELRSKDEYIRELKEQLEKERHRQELQVAAEQRLQEEGSRLWAKVEELEAQLQESKVGSSKQVTGATDDYDGLPLPTTQENETNAKCRQALLQRDLDVQRRYIAELEKMGPARPGSRPLDSSKLSDRAPQSRHSEDNEAAQHPDQGRYTNRETWLRKRLEDAEEKCARASAVSSFLTRRCMEVNRFLPPQP